MVITKSSARNAVVLPRPPSPQPQPSPREPDLVDAIFDLLLREQPELAKLDVEVLKRLTREEFGGRRGLYVRVPQDDGQRQVVTQVLALFNGRNASEVARKLGIGRATVYRLLKQARTDAKESHAFP